MVSEALRNAAFASQCAEPCPELQSAMDGYAAFHQRVFDPQAPCAARRVLVVRESFSDAVGIGQMHSGFQRWVALALVLGRALVFSPCESADDAWAVRGAGIFKNAQPYSCGEPHLDFAEYYGGHAGIDYRWTPARRELLRGCGIHETRLDFSSADLPSHDAHQVKCAFAGCDLATNPDIWMSCGKWAGAHCPALHEVFGARYPAHASAPLLA
eukprot:4644519-Prymnesium_polylepis.1